MEEVLLWIYCAGGTWLHLSRALKNSERFGKRQAHLFSWSHFCSLYRAVWKINWSTQFEHSF